MSLYRRQFLQVSATFSLLALVPLPARSGDSGGYLAARRRGDRYEVVLLDGRQRERRVIPLPGRGHSFAIDAPGRRAVAFGRQPGFFALAFRFDDDAPAQTLALPADRHFFGHGAFSADGRRLFATENDFEAGRGVVGVYDTATWQRLGEFDGGGIGPHELVLMADGKTLCVANGGILTHPDYGKLELNRDSMKPSLVYLDSDSGHLLEKVELAPSLYQLSIRHLAVDASGAAWFGCQHNGPASEQPPLVGRHRRGQAPELFAGPPEVLASLRNYIGSMAADASGEVIATSSPVGSVIAYWEASSGRCLGSDHLIDGCGIAPGDSRRFLISDGRGGIALGGPAAVLEPLAQAPGSAWDNHLRRI